MIPNTTRKRCPQNPASIIIRRSSFVIRHSSLLAAWFVLAAALAAFVPSAQAARLTLKSICRIKGQEENTIQGLGVIVGLKGTGDSSSYLPTIRSVAKIMSIMGNSPAGNAMLELKDTKNVALVLVTGHDSGRRGPARRQDRLRRQLDRLGQEPGRRAAVPHAADRPRPQASPRLRLRRGGDDAGERRHTEHRPDPRRLPPGRGLL